MPLTVKDFEKTKEFYRYKDYEIQLYKLFISNTWNFVIYRDNQQKYHNATATGENYESEKEALEKAKEYIAKQEYKPKFKRGDIIEWCGHIACIKDVLTAMNINELDEKKPLYRVEDFTGDWKTLLDPQDMKKVGEITDMSILEGE